MSIAFRIGRMFLSKGTSALRAFFNVDFGYETDAGEFVGLFSVTDFSLFAKKDGSGYFVKGFARPRMRGAEVVKGSDGFAVRDPVYNRFLEQKSDNSWGPSKAAYKFDDLLTARARETYEKLTESLPAPVAAGQIDGDDAGSPFNSDDDELPF